MRTQKKLSTFIIVEGDRTISPVLTTIREYGRWLEENFNEYTCNYELYTKAVKGGTRVLEYHPGTRIGHYFDSNTFHKNELESWFFYQESQMMDKLRKMKLAEYRDAIPISVNDEEHRRMLRVYTIDQIELYIKSNIDKSFNMTGKYLTPKQIKIRYSDYGKMIKPTIQKRKSLLDNVSTSKPVEMTLKEIEKELGHKVSIISKED
jgi:hypothetical protein